MWTLVCVEKQAYIRFAIAYKDNYYQLKLQRPLNQHLIQPTASSGSGRKMAETVTNHKVFTISNKGSGSYLSLEDAHRFFDNNAVPLQGASDITWFKQLWHLVDTQKKDYDGSFIFTFRCLSSGTDLTMGAATPGSNYRNLVSGDWAFQNPAQEWATQCVSQERNEFIIKNMKSGKVLEVIDDNGLMVCCNDAHGGLSQTWTFSRKSRGKNEIDKIFNQTFGLQEGAFQHYIADGCYINLPDAVRQDIWKNSLMGSKYKWREEIFDCDDFAFNMKAEVAKWAYDNIKANHISFLMGMMWGINTKNEAHAYNWFLTQDLQRIQLYEPQEGWEGSPDWLSQYNKPWLSIY